jgi:hypothetical protein
MINDIIDMICGLFIRKFRIFGIPGLAAWELEDLWRMEECIRREIPEDRVFISRFGKFEVRMMMVGEEVEGGYVGSFASGFVWSIGCQLVILIEVLIGVKLMVFLK